jgi:hypothetical protein
MATDIVQSLFGVTPQAYQQAQQDRMDLQALQYAKLDPFQQANYAIGRGASGLAGAIGGALGGQDPELQRITMRQQIAGQIDFSDDESMKRGIAALAQSDPQGAMQLQQVLVSQQAKRASIGKDEAAARASDAAATRDRTKAPPAIDKDIQIAEEISSLQERIFQFQNLPASPERDQALRLASIKLQELQRLSTKAGEKPVAPNIKEVGTAVGSGKAVYTYQTADGVQQITFETDADGKQVMKPYVGPVDRTTAKTNVDVRAPGAPVKPKDWMDFTLNVLSKDPVMNRTSTILSDAPSAIEIIRSSTTNDISAAALPGALARLTGEGKNMSNQDVARFARTGGLDDRLAQDAVKFFAGTATSVKKDQAEKFATALYRGALIERRKKLVNESEQYGYLDSPNYQTALRQIDDQLSQFKLKTKGGAEKPSAPATKTGVPLIDKYISPDLEKK